MILWVIIGTGRAPGWHYDTVTRNDFYEFHGAGRAAGEFSVSRRADRMPMARYEDHAAPGGVASDPPAHGPGMAAVCQGRPPYHGRDALRGGDPGQGPGVARHRLQHAAPVH